MPRITSGKKSNIVGHQEAKKRVSHKKWYILKKKEKGCSSNLNKLNKSRKKLDED